MREEIGEWISEVAEAFNLCPRAHSVYIDLLRIVDEKQPKYTFPNPMWFTSISICDERSERRRPKTWLLLTHCDCHADYSASDRRPIHAYAFVGTRLREESEREGGRWAG